MCECVARWSEEVCPRALPQEVELIARAELVYLRLELDKPLAAAPLEVVAGRKGVRTIRPSLDAAASADVHGRCESWLPSVHPVLPEQDHLAGR